MTAPTSAPATYEQALAAAEAIVAARGATQSPVATLTVTSQQISATRESTAEWAKTAIRRLWGAVDPYSPAQVKAFTEQAATLMESAQTAVARVAAAGTQQSLASVGAIVDAAPSNPIDVRAPAAIIKNGLLTLQRRAVSVTYDGTTSAADVSRADMSTRAVFERPAAVYRWAKSAGKQDPAGLALDRIDDLVDTNLMLAQRLASQEMIVRAANLDDTGRSRGRRGVKVIGYRRVIHPEMSRGGTCGMCIAASDRVYHVAELMPIHGGCHCTVAAITEDYDPADELNAVDLSQLYKEAGGTSAAHLKRTRYKVDQHGELGAVLVPGKKYNPRSDTGKRANQAIAPSAAESPADIARRHLPILEANLAKLREAGAGSESPQVQYHLAQIERFHQNTLAKDGGTRGKPSSQQGKGMELVKNTPHPPAAAGGGGGGTTPPGQNRPIGTGDEDPRDRLNRLFEDQTASATPEQRSAVRRWQGTDRFYEKVQKAVAGDGETEAMAVAQELADLARPLPEDVTVWRGVRSTARNFGVAADKLEALINRQWIEQRFLATTISKDGATPEFTHPGAEPAILRIVAKAGALAVWVPPLGADEHAGQNELLFTSGADVRILGVDYSGDIPLIDVEVR